MTVTVKHIVEVMDKMAPSSLAEQWDNVGLQVGNERWPLKKILVALDPSHQVLEEAARRGVGLVITHHPLIFEPMRTLDPGTPTGKAIVSAIENRIGVFCAHTNLDSAKGGLNDMLAQRLGLKDTTVLSPKDAGKYKLVVYVPEGHEDKIAHAMFEAGAGIHEKYSRVSFQTAGTGTFEPSPEARPHTGEPGVFTRASEYRIEVVVPGPCLSQVTEALLSAHPYEEAVYDAYPLWDGKSQEGFGRIGNIAQEETLASFGKRVKEIMGLSVVKVAGEQAMRVKRVAVCAGSGRGLLNAFVASDAHVFVSGDLGYHDGLLALEAGRAVIDIGHFASEHVVVEELAERLRKAVGETNYPVEVIPCDLEKDCYTYL